MNQHLQTHVRYRYTLVDAHHYVVARRRAMNVLDR
jgi:hypothetical protein